MGCFSLCTVFCLYVLAPEGSPEGDEGVLVPEPRRQADSSQDQEDSGQPGSREASHLNVWCSNPT